MIDKYAYLRKKKTLHLVISHMVSREIPIENGG